MRIRKMTLAAALLLVSAVAVGSASPLFTEEVTDFGRNRWRNHFTPTEPEFPLSRNARAIWEVPLGLSRSQPLVVQRDFNQDGQPETRIFHIAGDQLWALNGDMIPSRRQGQGREQYLDQLRAEGFILWNTPVGRLCSSAAQLTVLDELLAQGCSVLGPDAKERPFSSSQAAYWRGTSPDRDVIYVGFGHPASVVAIEAKTGRMLGGHIVEAGSDRGIVGAPLVFPGDTVVIGTTGDLSSGDPDKQGEVFIIKGLTGGTASVRALRVGGRISFSPVPLGESGFIIASDARHTPELGYHGYMMAYGLRTSEAREFTPRWPAAVITPAGIPGEAALDAQTVYFADKFGRLYALRLDTGELLWCRQYPGLGPCAPGGNPARAFINSGPGVDEDRVYFVFRNREGPNKGSGAVVALNKGTGQPVWEQPMDFEGNTSPVPMG